MTRKILIVYYSRSGNTKKVINQIKLELDCDSDEIIDLKDRSGIIGWIVGGKDALFNKSTEITNKINPQNYDLIIIATPVWVGTMVPAIKAYINKYNLKNKQFAFIATYGGSVSNTFNDLEKLTSKPIATLEIKDKLVNSKDLFKKTQVFSKKIKNIKI